MCVRKCPRVCVLFVCELEIVCVCDYVCVIMCVYVCFFVCKCVRVSLCICVCVVTCTNQTTKIADSHELISQVGSCES